MPIIIQFKSNIQITGTINSRTYNKQIQNLKNNWLNIKYKMSTNIDDIPIKTRNDLNTFD